MTKNEIEIVERNKKLLEKAIPKMKMVLPKEITPERMTQIALTCLRVNPKLLKCNPLSFLASVIQLSQLGLPPDSFLGYSYLVPYKDQVQPQLGFKGFIELAKRSGKIVDVIPHIVYENEPFVIRYGLENTLNHEPKSPSKRGVMIGAYSVVVYKEGSKSFRFMWNEEIDDIRKLSKFDSNPETSVWARFYEAMAMKTVIRQQMKYQSLSVETSQAVSIDEMSEAGKNTQKEVISELSDVIDISDYEVSEVEQPKARRNKKVETEISIPGGASISEAERKHELLERIGKIENVFEATKWYQKHNKEITYSLIGVEGLREVMEAFSAKKLELQKLQDAKQDTKEPENPKDKLMFLLAELGKEADDFDLFVSNTVKEYTEKDLKSLSNQEITMLIQELQPNNSQEDLF